MKTLLFALGLALCCVVQAEWEEVTTCREEDLGRWVSFAVACNSSDSLEQIKHMPAFVADLSKPKEDVLSILAIIPMPDGCKKVTYQFRKGEDGKYHSPSGDTKVTVESVKIWGEFVMSIININDEFRTTTLHGDQSRGLKTARGSSWVCFEAWLKFQGGILINKIQKIQFLSP
ncbi:hypothetical protein L345_17025, partial [Ophiophagus hannah]